ncbi:HD-GYP domain-containing protein [Neobacillus sp. D3-1R]|uniref:HD-GYP domain-containing protein n=1 Tax=Neobacillus sp. D3-1R TaxID=3445778 RepID=UPI003F9F874A
MINKIDEWLNRPTYFRYWFVIILIINIMYWDYFEQQHLFVFYILANIFLGIGFYDQSTLFLFVATTLVALTRFLLDPYQTTMLTFIILLLTYFLVVVISSGLIKRNKKIKRSKLELISALSNALDSRDPYTMHHSNNVAQYSLEIAKKMNLSDSLCDVIYKGALLHDIGKIGVPENILLKPSKLTNDEYTKIKLHSSIGHEIIKHVSDFNGTGILDIVLYHHERYDGKGYPLGLKGEEIPLVARIVAIADTFDAMISKRVYRDEMDLDSTLEEIRNNRGTHFDPKITDVFLSLYENDATVWKDKEQKIAN